MSSEKRSSLAIVAVALTVSGLSAMLFAFSASEGAGQVIASGRFHQVAHRGAGQASIYRTPDGKLFLRLAQFRTDHGRDLQVLMIAATDAMENETVLNAESISLGPLQEFAGDQSYRLPDELDLLKYKAVTVWNSRYLVNFTTAPLALN